MNTIERPLIVKLIKIRNEAKKIKTLYFKYRPIKIEAGQFFMVWDFKDEIPISISYIGNTNLFGITIKEVGETTKHLISLSEGDEIGVRGPFGNPFKPINNGKILVTSGGIGLAPLMPLIQKLISIQNITTTCVIGAKSANEIPFLKELQSVQSKFFKLDICTDDGSMGFEGFVSDYVKELLGTKTFDYVYTCGPELMMKKIFNLTQVKNIPLQASLERIMKCGIGICGQCVIDPLGLRICKDGPILNNNQLNKLSDFGKYKRGFDGSIHQI